MFSASEHSDISQYQWLVILGGFASFAMAWGIGANDVANCFGTSVGSKAITLKQAVIIASIFEFAGALILGAAVTNTVRSGITDFNYFEGEEDLLMLGMFSSLVSAALWLYFATKWELPVSTTHSIIGSIAGFTIMDKGINAIQWNNIYQIIIWWLATPTIAAVFVTILFYPIRQYIIKRQNAYAFALRLWPLFVFLVIFIMTIFLIEKGIQRFDVHLSIGVASALAFGIGVIVAIGAYLVCIRTGFMQKFVHNRCKNRLLVYDEKQAKPRNTLKTSIDTGYKSVSHNIEYVQNDNEHKLKEVLLHGMNVDILENLSKKEETIRNECETFDPQIEESFAWLQVLTAIFAVIAHGSNDVANAVAPFAAMIGIYQSGGVTKSVDVDWKILALGGFGMSVGLLTYGYKIIKCLGARMAAMSCVRGYCIELSAATTIIVASYYGQPASTTHALVGATVGCGLQELLSTNSNLTYKNVINWSLLLQVFVGWILTLFVSGATSAGIFALLAYSPAARTVCHHV